MPSLAAFLFVLVPALGPATPQEPAPVEDAGLSEADVAAAARVAGLALTPEELAPMAADAEARLAAIASLRALEVRNAEAPALVFTPLLPGLRATPRPAVRATPPVAWPPIARPDDPAELLWLSIPELGALLRSGGTSAVELTDLALARLAAVDPQLHCVITLLPERARARALELDAELARGVDRGPLHGIPWGAKDLLAVAGAPTTWGAAPFRDQVLEHTATVVERLDAAGANLVAKLTLGALAMGDVWFGGTTRTPWDPRRGSSGSSAGSAASVAAGALPFAIGSETLGSIVSPSARCGTSSIRPTFGRVSRDGAMTLCWSMDKLGPMARSIEDAGLVLAAIQGPDGRDPSVLDRPLPDPRSVDAVGLRVGYPREAFGERATWAGDLGQVLLDLEAAGHELVPVELPEAPWDGLLLVLDTEAAAAFDAFTREDRDDELVAQGPGTWPGIFRSARLTSAVDYLQAQRLRVRLMRDLDEVMAGVDLLVHPPFADGVLLATNLTGHPTLTTPLFVGDRARPSTVCWTGRLFDEATLVAVAAAWQAGTGHHRVHPPEGPLVTPSAHPDGEQRAPGGR